MTETSETSIDSQKVTGIPPEPSESAIHGREVHVAKQKQTQKEVCIETFHIACTTLIYLPHTMEKSIARSNAFEIYTNKPEYLCKYKLHTCMNHT